MYTLCFILLICISVLTCRLVRLYVSKDIQEVTPSTLRGFEHSTASYLILPSHRHRQALRRMRHLHWHSLVRSQVSRHRIRQWPNLWTSYCFTKNPYPTLNRHVETLWSKLHKPLSYNFGTKRVAEAWDSPPAI